MRLTQFTATDAPVLRDADQDPEHRLRFDIPDSFTASLEHSQRVIQRWAEDRGAGVALVHAVRRHASDQLLGGVELRPREAACANVSYWTFPGHRGQGIATRAVALAVALGFGPLGLHGLEVLVDPDNTASLRVAWSNGFREVGEREGQVLHVRERGSARP